MATLDVRRDMWIHQLSNTRAADVQLQCSSFS